MGSTDLDLVKGESGIDAEELSPADLMTAIGILEQEAKAAAERIRTLSEDRLALTNALSQQERLLLEARKQHRRTLIYVAVPYIIILAPISFPILLVLYLMNRRRKRAGNDSAPFLLRRDQDGSS